MKTILVLLTGVLTMSAASAATAIDSLLQEARRTLAPDRRTAVFDVRGEFQGDQLVLRGEVQSGDLRQGLLLFLEERGVRAVDSLVVLPHPSLGEATYGVVSLSVANIRTKPGHAAEMGTQALLGTPVRLLKSERGGWFLLQTPDDYLGWSDDHIVRMTKGEFDAWRAKKKVIVTAEFAFVRKSLDQASDIVSDVTLGGVLGLIRDVGSSYEVEFPDGRTGFLAGTAAEVVESWLARAQDTPESIVATAKRFFGVPYFWGGTSAKGLDCSGFTKTIYYLNGVLLPRDADQQALVGEPVELTEDFAGVKPGDILYFGSRGSEQRPGRVTHVAISLGGKRFIHASSYVMPNSFDPADADYAPGRARSLLGVRRIIGAPERTGVRHLSYLEPPRP